MGTSHTLPLVMALVLALAITTLAACTGAEPSAVTPIQEEAAPAMDPTQAFAQWLATEDGNQETGLVLAQARRQHLHTLIARDPALALAQALPQPSINALPEALQREMEQHIDMIGTWHVIVAVPCTTDHQHDESCDGVLRFVEIGGVLVRCHPLPEAQALPTIDKARIRGIRIDNAIAVAEVAAVAEAP